MVTYNSIAYEVQVIITTPNWLALRFIQGDGRSRTLLRRFQCVLHRGNVYIVVSIQCYSPIPRKSKHRLVSKFETSGNEHVALTKR